MNPIRIEPPNEERERERKTTMSLRKSNTKNKQGKKRRENTLSGDDRVNLNRVCVCENKRKREKNWARSVE